MRPVSVLSFAFLTACATTGDMAFSAAHEVVDSVAAHHPDLVRLTLHAVPQGKSQCQVIASTSPTKRGLSDPEDVEALRTGATTVLDEPGAVDVTVPILMRNGMATAVAGVTLTAPEGADRTALVARARSIAGELAAAVNAANAPLW